tara:strand:- start:2938 stop:3057 length:120 start_codon:yes stop_codon:yes gene_type:complete
MMWRFWGGVRFGLGGWFDCKNITVVLRLLKKMAENISHQ